MSLFHHITVFFISEQEKKNFLEAGVEFREVTRGPGGECAVFEIGEDDARWERVAALVAALEGNDRVPKQYRVQNLSLTASMDEHFRQLKERAARLEKIVASPAWQEAPDQVLGPVDELMRKMKIIGAALRKSEGGAAWLDGYSGQRVEELLSLEGQYRTDSLVLAFEQAILQKAEREGSQNLTEEERMVLAVEALEREVNNGGYDQFFANSSREFAPTVVDALQRIGCKKTATITQRAIKAVGVSALTSEAIDAAMVAEDEQRLAKLNRCDDSYYKCAEPVAERLFAFIKANKAGIRF